MRDEQDNLDQEDAAHRLRLLVDAIQEEREALEAVRRLQAELARAKGRHKNAQRRLGELSFVERQRRERRKG